MLKSRAEWSGGGGGVIHDVCGSFTKMETFTETGWLQREQARHRRSN